MAKKKSRKPRKPSGPNPFYPTHSVLKKLARLLDWVTYSEMEALPSDLNDDTELVAWLDAMQKRGAVK